MDYCKCLKKGDHVEHILRGLAAGFTIEQIEQHSFIELCLKLGLNKTEIIGIVGPDTGYIFPVECCQTPASRGTNEESARKKQLQHLWNVSKQNQPAFHTIYYCKGLKEGDHVERTRRGRAAGFTLEQIEQHSFIELCFTLGLNKTQIIDIAGPNTGYIFPVECCQTHQHQELHGCRAKLS